MSIRSRDVADYQPNLNWQTVARVGIVFSFLKSTAGATLVSPTFAAINWAVMKVAGMQHGADHC